MSGDEFDGGDGAADGVAGEVVSGKYGDGLTGAE